MDTFTLSGLTRRQPMRSAPAAYIQSAIRGVIEHSDRANGSHPAESFAPFKYLPVWIDDPSSMDGVVIPKGSIVSVVTSKNSTVGFGDPADSTTIYIGSDYTGGVITADIDDSFFGYDDGMAGLLVLANGGTTVAMPTGAATDLALDYYTSMDTGRSIKTDGTPITIAVGGSNVAVTYARGANYPVGIVWADLYKDIRGMYLNYESGFDRCGLMARGYIEIPFVDVYKAHSEGGNEDATLGTALYNADQTQAAWYVPVARKHAFLYNGSKTAQRLVPGCLLKSDLYGKFVPEYEALTSISATTKAFAATPAEAVVTAQTVGRLWVTDSRWPKDMMNWVFTYPGSGMPGSETAGLPGVLFNFVKDVMYHSAYNTNPSPKVILDAVQAGIFGTARLQLTLA